jgi:uncharacterized protein YjbI with pentapeptide repeats
MSLFRKFSDFIFVNYWLIKFYGRDYFILRIKSPGRRILKIVKNIFIYSLLLYILGVFVLKGYDYEFTGFNNYQIIDNTQHFKTLWDWIELLIAPIFILLFGVSINITIRTRNEENEDNRKQETALELYFDKSSELLLTLDLKKQKIISKILRARTLLLLTLINGVRKKQVLRFLLESSLIELKKPKLNLIGADFSELIFDYGILDDAELKGVIFYKAKFIKLDISNSDISHSNFVSSSFEYSQFNLMKGQYSNFSKAYMFSMNFRKCNMVKSTFENAILRRAVFNEGKFNRAKFTFADLSRAKIFDSDLSDANFEYSKLQRAEFFKVNFEGSDFSGADFKGSTFNEVNLLNSNITLKQIRQLALIQNSIMPNGKKVSLLIP